MSWAFRFSHYKADNNWFTGFGGLLISKRLKRINSILARKLAAQIAIKARQAEAEAAGNYIVPGHVSKAFSDPRFRDRMNPYRLKSGRVNRRWSTLIEYTGRYEGYEIIDGDRYTKSDPIVLEAGSRYNEGTPGDRPALNVLRSSLRDFAAKHVGIRHRTTGRWE